MELSQIKYFLEAAKTNNFTLAAQRLYVSQPTLSKAINTLENELGVNLFDRDGKNIYLNSFGLVFQEHAMRIISEIEDAKRKITDMSTDASGQLDLAFSIPDASPSNFITCIENFLMDHPKVFINKYYMSTQEIVERLRDNSIDLGITQEFPDTPLVSWWPLITKRVGVTVSQYHPLASRKSLSLTELRDEVFVDCGANLDQQNLTHNLCQKAGFQPKILFSGNANTLTETLLFKRNAVMLSTQQRYFIPPSEVQAFASDAGTHENTVYIPLTDPFCVHRIGYATREGRYKTVALRRFVNYLTESFRRLSEEENRFDDADTD